jgi:hypothetical protein
MRIRLKVTILLGILCGIVVVVFWRVEVYNYPYQMRACLASIRAGILSLPPTATDSLELSQEWRTLTSSEITNLLTMVWNIGALDCNKVFDPKTGKLDHQIKVFVREFRDGTLQCAAHWAGGDKRWDTSDDIREPPEFGIFNTDAKNKSQSLNKN